MYVSEEFELPANGRRSEARTSTSDNDESAALFESDSHFSKSDGIGKQFAVGLTLLRQIRRIGRVLRAARARLGLWSAGLIVGKLAAEMVYYYAGMLPSEFYRVLGDRDSAAFGPLLFRCVAVVAVAGACRAALDYAAGVLGVAMRHALTQHTQARYLRRGRLYAVASASIDNPDQRVAQDIERLARSAADVLAELLLAPFLVAYYTARCWALAGVFGPVAIYAYFIVGATATQCVMAPIVRRVVAQEKAEGDFRFHHVRVRECAEAIAFYGGEAAERERADAALTRVVDAQYRVLWRQLGLGLLTQVFSYMGSTVSYVVIAVPIFMGSYDGLSGAELSSVISRNAFVSLYLIYRFSVVIEQAKRVAELAGYAARVVQLWEALDRADTDSDVEPDTGGAPYTAEDKDIVVSELTVATPGGAVLVSNLGMRVSTGESLVVTGPPGSGKTSLLRALCGVWQPARGTVRVPRSGVFFLPQTPYIAGGSLREQLSYPGEWGGRARACSDTETARLLSAVGLAHILRRAGHIDRPWSVQEWLQMMSPGEQQKLSIARVLFWRPLFAVLDEATSALDAAAEAALYRALLDAAITVVSVSHHDGLNAFHKRHLALDGHGGFAISSI
ncbi:hypothetical protein GGF43_003176 [Coemansia sp. RSA 2618]|nr:hypothetical protein GGF43_003176 [Coemansia sp. RSA 2618]